MDQSPQSKQRRERGGRELGRNEVRVLAPYNFVPLSKEVFFPSWQDRISHDIPFRDGLSGRLGCTLTTVSPLYVRNGGLWDKDQIRAGNAPAEYLAFFNVGGQVMIPATSLKGMIRNVVEIASFGKIGLRVNDARYSVRDLFNKELYTKHMTDGSPERGFKARPRAGWLTAEPDTGCWRLRPCEYARVEQTDLIAHRGEAAPDIRSRMAGPAKYTAWGPDLEIAFDLGAEEGHRHSCGILHYRKAANLGKGSVRGTLVFTGQPSPHTFSVHSSDLPGLPRLPKEFAERLKHDARKNLLQWTGMMTPEDRRQVEEVLGEPFHGALAELFRMSREESKEKTKHLEFIFFDESPKDHIIADPDSAGRRLDKEFEFVHSEPDGGPNPEWKHWRAGLDKGQRVPVFYLGKPEEPESLGLAMMYRLPYRHTVREAVSHTSKNHLCEAPDLADCVFGYTEDRRSGEQGKKLGSLKGRVSISPGLTVGDVRPLNEQRVVLGAPKPTYYPSYMEQQTDARGRVPVYRTFMDEESRIRGWKRYPARRPDAFERVKGESDKIVTRFIPIDKDAKFLFDLRFFNLKPEELGALVWALTWGGDPRLRHGLGMGKSIGFGQVRIEVRLEECRDAAGNEVPDQSLDKLRKTFEDLMKTEVAPDWHETPQLVQLLAMADPDREPQDMSQREKLRHMRIGKGASDNEFARAKKANARLMPHAAFSGKTDEERFKRKPVSRGEEDRREDSASEAMGAPMVGEPLNTAARPVAVADRFRHLCGRNSLDAFMEFFKGLSEADLHELAQVDFRGAAQTLSTGIADRLAEEPLNENLRALLCVKILENTSTKSSAKWDDKKKKRVALLKEWAAQWRD
jgi:hypothetical protein